MKKIFIILAVIIATLISLILIFSNKDDNHSYLKEINYEDYINMVNDNETFILYVKQTNCKHCTAFTPIFTNVLNKNKVLAYVINLTDMDNDNKETFLNELSINGTPTVLFFQEGVELGKFSRISGEKSAEYVTKKLKDLGFIKDSLDDDTNKENNDKKED